MTPSPAPWSGSATRADRFLSRGVSDDSGKFDLPRLDWLDTSSHPRIGYRPKLVPIGPPDSIVDVTLRPSHSPLAAQQAPIVASVRGSTPRHQRFRAVESSALSALGLARRARSVPPVVKLHRAPSVRAGRQSDDRADDGDQAGRKTTARMSPRASRGSSPRRLHVRGRRAVRATTSRPTKRVLFDPSFVETHCLRAVVGDPCASVASRRQLRARSSTPIAIRWSTSTGTLWITTEKPRLSIFRVSLYGPRADGERQLGEISIFRSRRAARRWSTTGRFAPRSSH